MANTHKFVARFPGDKFHIGTNKYLEDGDPWEPSEGQLKAFPGLFEPIKRGRGRPKAKPKAEPKAEETKDEGGS